MNIALFGGTFDPVHSGHLAAATAAQKTFGLDQVLFVPARRPPHKMCQPMTPFLHRYTMVALACSGKAGLFPSSLEKDSAGSPEPNYSITTVRKIGAQIGETDQLFFLIGADAFLHIRDWKEPVALLDACDFIVVSRPGFDFSKIAAALPDELQPARQIEQRIPLRRSSLHLLTTVKSEISSSAIRQRVREGKSLTGLVPAAVHDYIQKLELFSHERTAE